MRQRITFVHEPGRGIDFQGLQIAPDNLSGPEIEAVREDRITLAPDELPKELTQFLQRCRELHVRWVSPLAHETVAPLSSRLSPGFHVLYTSKSQNTEPETQSTLCEVLNKTFNIRGCSPPGAFTHLPSSGPSQPVVLQYYEPREDLAPLVDYAVNHLCPSSGQAASCQEQAKRLRTASSLDISYDITTQSLKVTAQWPKQRQAFSISSTPGHRTEVGILGGDAEARAEAHEVGISGGLVVLGEHTAPAPVMFAVPSRHRQSRSSSFSSSFASPTGLHPTLQLKISSARPPVEDGDCVLQAHFTLPKTVFADRYQLSDELFLASKNLTALRYSSSPVDLEAPVYATDTWGSSILLELAPPKSGGDSQWTAEVPLHLRYLAPNSEGYADIEVPYPAVFWACPSQEGDKFANNPFDRVNLGYDALVEPGTTFWHLEQRAEGGGEPGRLMSPIRVPVLDEDDAPWIRTGTAVAVMVGFGWVLWTLVSAYRKNGYGRVAEAEASRGKEKKKQ